MSEKVDWIWYENPTRPAPEQREPANLKQSPEASRQKPQEPSATQPKNAKPIKAKSTG